VIGADAGGIPDIVGHGRNGLLVEPESVPSLADGMLRLARDGALLGRLAERSRPSAEQLCLSPDEYAQRVEALVA